MTDSVAVQAKLRFYPKKFIKVTVLAKFYYGFRPISLSVRRLQPAHGAIDLRLLAASVGTTTRQCAS